MADHLYIRYMGHKCASPARCSGEHCFPHDKARSRVMWVEWKRKTGKAMAHQKQWHEIERSRGALTLIAGIDFTASIEGFQEWYRVSGLMLRKI